VTTFYCLKFENPKPGGLDPRIYVPQEHGGSVIHQALGFPFVASYDSQGYGEGIPTPPPGLHGVKSQNVGHFRTTAVRTSNPTIDFLFTAQTAHKDSAVEWLETHYPISNNFETYNYTATVHFVL
jgi:hypothetical protein